MAPIDIYERTYHFALNTIKIANHFSKSNASFIIADQLIRSGCSVGANLREARQSRSKKEFINHFGIALKEAEEVNYWLNLVADLGLTAKVECDKLIKENIEIIKILTVIIKKSKTN